MPMANPPHPGRIVLRDCLEALGLTVAEAAEHMQMAEEELDAICRCEAPITADAAIRFELAFGSTAVAWLSMQTAHDLAEANRLHRPISRIDRPRDASTFDHGFEASARLNRLASAVLSPSPSAQRTREIASSWRTATSQVCQVNEDPAPRKRQVEAA